VGSDRKCLELGQGLAGGSDFACAMLLGARQLFCDGADFVYGIGAIAKHRLCYNTALGVREVGRFPTPDSNAS